MSVAYAVVVPHRYGTRVPSARVYARRRVAAALVLSAFVLVLLVGAGQVLASRGGAPASTPAVRPATAAAAPSAPAAASAVTTGTATYLVQPGDTLWSIAAAHRGSKGQSAYVDALVAGNGGTSLSVGQLLTLP